VFNNIIAGMVPTRYISSVNDPLFEFHRWPRKGGLLTTRPTPREKV
jgi:hypothetical protein